MLFSVAKPTLLAVISSVKTSCFLTTIQMCWVGLFFHTIACKYPAAVTLPLVLPYRIVLVVKKRQQSACEEGDNADKSKWASITQISFTALKSAGVVRPTGLAIQIIFLFTGHISLASFSVQHNFLSLYRQFSGKFATFVLAFGAASRITVLLAVVHGSCALTHIALQEFIWKLL